MISTTLFPGRYIQGAGALSRLGGELSRLGKRHLVICAPSAHERLLPDLLPDLEKAGEVRVERFGRECTEKEIRRLLAAAREFKADVVAALGGGKTLDAAKSVAARAGIPVAVAPTVASTDAPCSSLTIIYTEDGVFERVDYLPRNPDLVLADTRVIARAPARFLASGMGDALATWFEADSCRISRGKNIAGDTGSMAAHALARLCYETVRDWGQAALTACGAGVVTPALERVVEANTLLSGLGVECVGCAGAHSLNSGFSAVEACRNYTHGEIVAFGTLCQLVLENRPKAEIEEVLDFSTSVGLPVTLAEIGLDARMEADLRLVAERAAKAKHIAAEPVTVNPEIIYHAILAADAMGRGWKTEG